MQKVVHWPPVLVISFKRFEFNARTLRNNRVSRHIDYPMLFPVRHNVRYHLRAVIIHGGGASAGHYWAYVRAHDEQWYYCNDSAEPRIVPNPGVVLKQQAYMLIYER